VESVDGKGHAPRAGYTQEGGEAEAEGQTSSAEQDDASQAAPREEKSVNDQGADPMCRNIKTLFNFAPPVTDDEVRASSLQFVRKLSGFTKPAKANEAAFNLAVDQVSEAARTLLHSLVTTAPPKDREAEAIKARARSAKRFGKETTDKLRTSMT
jgi:hypothetical protein